MAIMMEQPSISFNSHDVPGPHYKMWRTVDVPEGTAPSVVASQIAAANEVAKRTEGSPLRNIIINSHGNSGKISIGGRGKLGIDKDTVGAFGILRSLNIGTIWLVACEAAKDVDGQNLCQMLAKVAGTQVIAADEEQEVTAYQTYRYYFGLSGQIDDFEGTVYSFTPVGGVRRGIDPEEDVWTVKK